MHKIDKTPASPKHGSPQTSSADPAPQPMPLDAIEVVLEIISPDEPLGPPEGEILKQQRGAEYVLATRERWPKRELEKRAKYRGYQPGGWYRENMKYGQTPGEDAPLPDWLTAIVRHAKALWSRDLQANVTRQQFVEWLPSYLDNDDFRWTDAGKLEAAAQYLREMYCMSPRPPTRRTRR